MLFLQSDYFDLKQIADSGQCFRMVPLKDAQTPSCFSRESSEKTTGFSVISRSRLLKIYQRGEEFFFHCPDEDNDYWLFYFDLKRDYQSLAASVSCDDQYLCAAAKAGRGIRILNQNPWEMIITFVISQQKTIPKIREAVEALSRHYGSPIPSSPESSSFPDPYQLSKASLEELQALKLGYRAKYIYRICQDAVLGHLDLSLLPAMNYSQAMEYLTKFYGIGTKVANCICLFGLHQIDAFPVDTWIQKILLKEYYNDSYSDVPKSKIYEKIVKDHFSQYKGYAGLMQQYIFFYERLLQGKG